MGIIRGGGGGIFLREIFLEPKKKIRRLRSQILTCLVFMILLSKQKYGFTGKGSPSENNVIAEEELDYIDVGDIGNFGD